MDWQKLAKELLPGHSRRVNCWRCGGKKTAGISNHGDFYSVHCFKCKHKEGAKPPPMTPQERLALRRAVENFKAEEPTLPEDFTTDIPVEGLLWLTKGGLHIDDIKRYGFGWSPAMRRVIMPVLESSGQCSAIQARRVDTYGDGPKYIGSVWSGPRPVFRCYPKGASSGPIVLTEDILSAARVGKVCEAWSLLGTNLMPAVLARLIEEDREVIVWMDDDEAGHKARKKMLRQIGAVGLPVRAILSDRDPKHHTIEEMKEMLYGI